MAVTEESEAAVRKLREDAMAYADRVMAGEEPWKDAAEKPASRKREAAEAVASESAKPEPQSVESALNP